MEDDEFRAMIVQVVGAVVDEPEMQQAAGSGKVYSFGALDADVNWYIDATDAPVFGQGMPERFDVRAMMTKEVWVSALSGKASATQLMLRKKIKVEGSVMAMASLSMDALIRTYKREIEGQS